MQYRTLGRTGVHVSTLVLGAMNFGRLGRTTQDEVTAMVDAALNGGINLIDTADMYSQGESEEMVGKAIAGRRNDVVLATKAGLPMGGERNHQGSSRRWLVTELDNSLRRQGVDHIDLYEGSTPSSSSPRSPTRPALTMIQIALGFVTSHPAVTSAIIGPRAIDHLHSQLAAADTVLSTDVLDAIDAVVAPGVDLAADEKYDTPPALIDPKQRRR